MILSVVIPTMNKVALLKRTLGALLEQDSGIEERWEIVVVDDGSTDETADYLKDLVAHHGTDRPALHVVAPGMNLGRARARNLGARNATGQWILFLDDDIVVPPGLPGAHLAALRAHPGCGTIGCAVTAPEVFDAPHFHYLDTRGVARLQAGPAPARYFVTQNAAVPRREFLSIGGFDEEFSAYGFEDMEVAFRLEDETGTRFRVLPGPVPLHVHHHTLAEYFEKKRECGRSSLVRLAEIHPARLGEMRLDLVIDAPGGRPSARARLVRAFAGSPAGRRLPDWLERWPRTADHRPRWPAIYCQWMNLAVLCCFRQGVTESPRL